MTVHAAVIGCHPEPPLQECHDSVSGARGLGDAIEQAGGPVEEAFYCLRASGKVCSSGPVSNTPVFAAPSLAWWRRSQ
eukprot:7379642-Alexandrium_andersonii.AAC.1